MRPVSFHGPNNCYEMGKMGTVRLHTEKYGSPRHLTTSAIGTTWWVPLRYAPEVPKLKKTWVKKEGPIHQYFQDFVGQMAQAFIHKQLDKLTSDIHRRTVHGVDEQSKRLVLHCDFLQDLSHAMADQSMCKFFDIISSSLFICVAHFFVMYVHKGCDSPSIAMFTADTIWNAPPT